MLYVILRRTIAGISNGLVFAVLVIVTNFCLGLAAGGSRTLDSAQEARGYTMLLWFFLGAYTIAAAICYCNPRDKNAVTSGRSGGTTGSGVVGSGWLVTFLFTEVLGILIAMVFWVYLGHLYSVTFDWKAFALCFGMTVVIGGSILVWLINRVPSIFPCDYS